MQARHLVDDDDCGARSPPIDRPDPPAVIKLEPLEAFQLNRRHAVAPQT